MLVEQIWDFFVLALCGAAFAISALILSTNPHRSLNRFLASFLIILSSAQVLQLLGLNYGYLGCLRAAHVFAGLALVSAGLIHDTVLYPSSRFIVRLKREAGYLVPAFFIVSFPLTEWWLLQRNSPSTRGIFFGYLGLRVALVSWLFAKALIDLPKAPPERRFDAQNFCALAFFLFIAIIFGLVARLFSLRDALRWMEVIVGIYYPLVAWMMTSPRVYRARELIRIGLKFLLCLAFPLAVVLPLLTFAGHLSAFLLGMALVASAYPAMLLGNFVGSRVLDRFLNSSQDDVKTAIDALISAEWSESRLQERFCSIIGSFMGGAKVELVFLESLTENNLPPNRRLLAQEAARTGWLTVHSGQRQTKAKDMVAVQNALHIENLGLVLVSNTHDNRCVLFVSQLSSLKIITYPVIAFVSNLLSMYQLGRQRISLAHKAIYNDRLASIGFIASQISHEARNRLDAIRVALELLKAGREQELTPEHRGLLLQEMEAFLMDFAFGLDMARTDIGRISASRARSIIDEVVTIFGPYARRVGIQVEIAFAHETDEILVDRRLLRQALFNLLRNAADALKLTSDPRIILQTSNFGRKLYIDVIDNGPGVASEHYDRLFAEFNTSKESGTGLGLSLCRDVMALMNGSIHYITPKGKPNACFRLSLPLAAESEYSDCSVPMITPKAFHAA
jgi:signal transduction histidine kinase